MRTYSFNPFYPVTMRSLCLRLEFLFVKLFFIISSAFVFYSIILSVTIFFLNSRVFCPNSSEQVDVLNETNYATQIVVSGVAMRRDGRA